MMLEKHRTNVRGAHYSGSGGLAGLAAPLLSVSLCGLSPAQTTEPPFPAWEYRPAYLPEPLVIQIGEADVEEPMWYYLDFMQRVDREQRFIEHPIDIREVTGLAVNSPKPVRSIVAQRMIESGILSTRLGVTPLLEIEFDDNRRNQIADFQPHFSELL
jgi:hypothetical protein